MKAAVDVEVEAVDSHILQRNTLDKHIAASSRTVTQWFNQQPCLVVVTSLFCFNLWEY